MLDHRMKADPKPFCDLPQIEWVKSPGLDTGAPRADGIRAEDKIGFQIGIVPADGTKAAVGTSLFLGSSSKESVSIGVHYICRPRYLNNDRRHAFRVLPGRMMKFDHTTASPPRSRLVFFLYVRRQR